MNILFKGYGMGKDVVACDECMLQSEGIDGCQNKNGCPGVHWCTCTSKERSCWNIIG